MEKTQRNNQTKTIIFIAIIVIQLFIIGWLVFDKETTRVETKVLITRLEYSKTAKDSLVEELKDISESYKDLETNNSALNSKLKKEQEKIEELLTQLKKVKSSDNYRISQYKDEIETLKNIMKGYIAQIDELNQKNKQLIAENTEIKENYDIVVTEREELVEKSDSLQNKVEIASELQVLNIGFVALNKRGKATKRIKKTTKFQICFTLNKNKITETGNKAVFIRIADPSGKILRNNTSGFFDFQGASIAFSSNKNITYDGKGQDICMYYNNSEDLPKGTYSVFIFIDGKQIETRTVDLK